MSAIIVVETGAGLTNSNSYVSAADLATYADARGLTIAGISADLLIKAMDYIESLNYRGERATSTQALQWPRYNVYIDRFPFSSVEIPQLLIDAQCEIAIGIDGGVNPLANEGRETRREKIGEIEVEYTAGSRSGTYLAAAHSKLDKLIMGGSLASARVTRV